MASAENIEVGFIPQEAPALPPEVSSPGSVSFGGTTFFYAQSYFGLSDPQNIENLLRESKKKGPNFLEHLSKLNLPKKRLTL